MLHDLNDCLDSGEDKKKETKSRKSSALSNRPFARSGHMVRNKLHWDANYAVGLSKQTKVELD